ncbi:hypothetical protein D3C87_84410 [compost metagenome]
MKKENLLIEPERKHTRKDLLIMILIGILFFVSAELLYPILKPYRSHSAPFTNGFFFAISALLIIYVLSRKIYHLIEIDYENNKLKIEYITLFNNDCESIIPFGELEYEYKKVASRSGGKWSLKIWKNKKKVLNLDEGDYGFEKEKLDLLVEKLKELE